MKPKVIVAVMILVSLCSELAIANAISESWSGTWKGASSTGRALYFSGGPTTDEGGECESNLLFEFSANELKVSGSTVECQFASQRGFVGLLGADTFSIFGNSLLIDGQMVGWITDSVIHIDRSVHQRSQVFDTDVHLMKSAGAAQATLIYRWYWHTQSPAYPAEMMERYVTMSVRKVSVQ